MVAHCAKDWTHRSVSIVRSQTQATEFVLQKTGQ
jgi:hypothetical protein